MAKSTQPRGAHSYPLRMRGHFLWEDQHFIATSAGPVASRGSPPRGVFRPPVSSPCSFSCAHLREGSDQIPVPNLEWVQQRGTPNFSPPEQLYKLGFEFLAHSPGAFPLLASSGLSTESVFIQPWFPPSLLLQVLARLVMLRIHCLPVTV